MLKELKSRRKRKAKAYHKKASAVAKAVEAMKDDTSYTAWDKQGQTMRTHTGKEWKELILGTNAGSNIEAEG